MPKIPCVGVSKPSFFSSGHLIPEENMNCVNQCTSPHCFGEIYGEDKGGPLEDGEVDYDRYFYNAKHLPEAWYAKLNVS